MFKKLWRYNRHAKLQRAIIDHADIVMQTTWRNFAIKMNKKIYVKNRIRNLQEVFDM